MDMDLTTGLDPDPENVDPEEASETSGDSLLEALQAETRELREELQRVSAQRRFVGLRPGESGEAEPRDYGSAYEAQLREARACGNVLDAIRVKQEAALEGVILI